MNNDLAALSWKKPVQPVPWSRGVGGMEEGHNSREVSHSEKVSVAHERMFLK